MRNLVLQYITSQLSDNTLQKSACK